MSGEGIGMGEGFSAEAKKMGSLQPGQVYRFLHKRKGVFIAEFLGEMAGDADDPIMWHVRIPTAAGSGQERFSNAMVRDASGNKVAPDFSEKHIRPSLVQEVSPHGSR